MDGDGVRHEPSARPTGPQTLGAEAPEAAARESREWSGSHAVNIRLSVPLLFGRYYVTLVAGKERRSAARRASERGKHPIGTLGNVAVLFVVGVLFGLAGFALLELAGAYVLMRTGAMVL